MCYWTGDETPVMPCVFANRNGEYCTAANKNEPGRAYSLLIKNPKAKEAEQVPLSKKKITISKPVEGSGSGWASQSGAHAHLPVETAEAQAARIEAAKSHLPNLMSLEDRTASGSVQGKGKGKEKAKEEPSPTSPAEGSGLKKLGKSLSRKLSLQNLKAKKK
ncbi:hypothetical protein MMC32_005345 [Xylographa parallela]|nr:hypothetical protein [Xylographa parallela]